MKKISSLVSLFAILMVSTAFAKETITGYECTVEDKGNSTLSRDGIIITGFDASSENLKSCQKNKDAGPYTCIYTNGESITFDYDLKNPNYVVKCKEKKVSADYFCVEVELENGVDNEDPIVLLSQSETDRSGEAGVVCSHNWFTSSYVTPPDIDGVSHNVTSGGIYDEIKNAESFRLKLASDLDFGDWSINDDEIVDCSVPYAPLTNEMVKVIDGNGHTIKNLCATNATGLIYSDNGFVNASFSNLTLEHVYMKGETVGALAAIWRYDGSYTTENVSVKNATLIATNGNAGGLFGKIEYMDNSEYGSNLTNVSVSDLTIRIENSATDTLAAGGLAGYAINAKISNFKGENISINSENQDKVVCLGGVVGYLNQNSGDGVQLESLKVSGLTLDNTSLENYAHMGGLIGYFNAYGSTENARFVNDVVDGASIFGGAYVGGFVGKMEGTDPGSASSMVVENSSFQGNIRSGCSEQSFLGGFLGFFSDGVTKSNDNKEKGVFISKSAVIGNISEAPEKCDEKYSNGRLVHIGGFVGRVNNGRVDIFGSYHKGDVNYENDGKILLNIGGFVGNINFKSNTCSSLIGNEDNNFTPNIMIANNYRITNDSIYSGVGSCLDSVWRQGSVGAYNNVRNTVGTGKASGKLGFYEHELIYSTGGKDYKFASPFENGTPLNGEVDVSSMKTDTLAAILNYTVELDDGFEYVWTRDDSVNDGYPSFANDNFLPIYAVVFDLNDYKGVVDYDERPYLTISKWIGGAKNESSNSGVVAYTDNKSQLSTDIINTMMNKETERYWGSAYAKLVPGHVFQRIETFELINKMNFKFEYVICPEGIGNSCVSIDQTEYMSLSPVLSDVSNDGSVDDIPLPIFWHPYQKGFLWPSAVYPSTKRNDNGKIYAKYSYGEEINAIIEEKQGDETYLIVYSSQIIGNSFWTYKIEVSSETLYRIFGGEPQNANMMLSIGGYPAAEAQDTIALDEMLIGNALEVPYAHSLKVHFDLPGYKLDSYKAMFIYGDEQGLVKTGAPNYFTSIDAFKKNSDGGVNYAWETTVESPDSALILDSVYAGVSYYRSNNGQSMYDGKIIIDPTFSPIEYIVNFNLEGKDVFYGNSWNPEKTYRVNDDLPSVYARNENAYSVVFWKSSETAIKSFNTLDMAFLLQLEPKRDEDSNYVLNFYPSEEATASVLSLDLVAMDEKGNVLNGESDNRGYFTLSQKYGSEEGDTIVHTSEWGLCSDLTWCQRILLPGNIFDDTLSFDVTFVPESGFRVLSVVLDTVIEPNENIEPVENSKTELTYNPKTKKLSLNPKILTSAEFKVEYGIASHDLALTRFKLDQSGKSGNAIRLNLEAAKTDYPRDVWVDIRVMDNLGNVVVDTLLVDSLRTNSIAFSWSKYPLKSGNYTVSVQMRDDMDTVYADTSFKVNNEIQVVSGGGWQMISMVAVDTSSIVWDSDPAFYWWDEDNRTGEYWQYKSFKRGDEIEANRGYWYSSLEGRPLILNPVELEAEEVVWNLDSVYSGWNMVANPYGWSINLYEESKERFCAVDEECDIQFYRYDAETADFVDVKVLKPYEAIWAHVNHSTEWVVHGEPYFDSDEDSTEALTKRRSLAKANSKQNWIIQAILSDNRGKKDSWNILGVNSRPFVSEEPPAVMGDHVNLSVMERGKALAKSFKAVSDSYEWEIALSASTERKGNLTLEGVGNLKSLGYHVYVTVDGNTFELNEGDNVPVSLKSRATSATVRVTMDEISVVAGKLGGLRITQIPGKIQVGFDVDESLAGSKTAVDVVNLDGRIVASFSSRAVAGQNFMTMDAPRVGLYMLRVRMAGHQVFGKVIIK